MVKCNQLTSLSSKGLNGRYFNVQDSCNSQKGRQKLCFRKCQQANISDKSFTKYGNQNQIKDKRWNVCLTCIANNYSNSYQLIYQTELTTNIRQTANIYSYCNQEHGMAAKLHIKHRVQHNSTTVSKSQADRGRFSSVDKHKIDVYTMHQCDFR